MNNSSKAGRLFYCLLVLVGGVLTMAPTPCNLRIAEYPGSSEKQGREGTSDVFAVDHELVQPIDVLTGQPSGVRQHRPFTVLKKIDKATPGFHKALSIGQTLMGATIDFYRIDPATRAEVKYYSVVLSQVRIVGIKTMMPTSFLPENESYGHMEEVRLTYRTIEWQWIPDSIVEADAWRTLAQDSPAMQSAADPDTQSTVRSAPAIPSSSATKLALPAETSSGKQNAK